MSSSRALHIETPTHGRVCVREASSDPRGAIVAFHGYAQSAEIMLKDLEGIAGIDAWTIVSVQGLHRFYTRDNKTVVASWMTREDREEAIADNLVYVQRAIDAAVPTGTPIVFFGYSQGAAMAYRAAAAHRDRAAAVIAIGGDVPPDVELAGAPPVLIGAGVRDIWYTPDKVRADAARLHAAGVAHDIVSLEAGHEWTDEFRSAAARWLARTGH